MKNSRESKHDKVGSQSFVCKVLVRNQQIVRYTGVELLPESSLSEFECL